MQQICDDLVAEHDALDALVDGLDEERWDLATPAPGWSVRDQVCHLWFFDLRALMALTDPDAFAADTRELLASGGTEASVRPGREMTGAALLDTWRRDRARLLEVARAVDPSARVPWYGPAMGARSFLTARLMETWAHGQDVADALGASRTPTDRLRHVAHIGVRARPFSYAIRGMAMPEADVHVALTTPSGDTGDVGCPRCRRLGARPDARLLPRRHPAAPPRRHRTRDQRRRGHRVDVDRPGVRRRSGSRASPRPVRRRRRRYLIRTR